VLKINFPGSAAHQQVLPRMPTNQMRVLLWKKNIKFNFRGGKNQFPGSAAHQTSFTANANQSNERVTVVKINFHRGKI